MHTYSLNYIFCWSTVTASSLFCLMRQALLISIWQLSAILLLISSPLKLYQVGWGQMHIFKFLQKYLIGFKHRLWLGHSSTFTELSTIYSCCVLRVIVLLEEESSAQSAGLNALDWVFIKDISIFWCIEIFFYSDESFSPCCWKTASYQHTLLLGWYSAGDDQRFPSNIMLGIEVHQTTKSFLKSFRSFFANSKCVFMCLHWREN